MRGEHAAAGGEAEENALVADAGNGIALDAVVARCRDAGPGAHRGKPGQVRRELFVFQQRGQLRVEHRGERDVGHSGPVAAVEQLGRIDKNELRSAVALVADLAGEIGIMGEVHGVVAVIGIARLIFGQEDPQIRAIFRDGRGEGRSLDEIEGGEFLVADGEFLDHAGMLAGLAHRLDESVDGRLEVIGLVELHKKSGLGPGRVGIPFHLERDF